VLRRRLGPRAGAAPDQGARGVEGEGGNAPGLGPAAGAQLRREHACSGGEGQLECKIYSQLCWTRPLASGPWTCPPAPRRLCAARRLAASERRIKTGRRGEKNENKNIFGCKRLQSTRHDAQEVIVLSASYCFLQVSSI
jgi:hypothetical protein